MNAVSVPYRSPRGLKGSTRLAGLAGSSKKRNWDAFNSAYPGTTVNSQGNYVMPAKFGGVVINQGQLDDLSGSWYGATFHPDGDQAGWQKKFDDFLRSYGAYNAFYGVTTPTPVVTTSPTPTGATPNPANTAVSIGTTIQGYAVNAAYLPLYRGTDNQLYFKTSAGNWALYIGPVSATAGPTTTPPVTTTLPAVGTSPPITVNVPANVPAADTSGLIQQLIAQGASQQQAFAAALQSLAAQGVQATPQVQQQVANDVANASQPQQASVLLLAGGVVLVIGLGIFMSRRKRR